MYLSVPHVCNYPNVLQLCIVLSLCTAGMYVSSCTTGFQCYSLLPQVCSVIPLYHKYVKLSLYTTGTQCYPHYHRYLDYSPEAQVVLSLCVTDMYVSSIPQICSVIPLYHRYVCIPHYHRYVYSPEPQVVLSPCATDMYVFSIPQVCSVIPLYHRYVVLSPCTTDMYVSPITTGMYISLSHKQCYPAVSYVVFFEVSP